MFADFLNHKDLHLCKESLGVLDNIFKKSWAEL